MTALPKEIGQLTALTSLDLDENQISALPKEITKLNNIKWITSQGNPLTNPPLEIVEKGIEAIREYFQSHSGGKVQQPVAKPPKKQKV